MNAPLRLVAALAVALTSQQVLAQLRGPAAPDTISVQGYLTDTSGDPITDTQDITTTFYKNGVAGYMQMHSNVSIVDGYFNVFIGPVDTVQFNRPIDLGIKVGSDPEMSPHTPLLSVPFALGTRGMHAYASENSVFAGTNVVGGWVGNYVAPGVVGATISGGGRFRKTSDLAEPDSVTGDFGTISGGADNTAASRAVVGGGQQNRATGDGSTIAGGDINTALGSSSAIGGGSANTAMQLGTVAGGSGNEAGVSAAVGGGGGNDATGPYSTIPGGWLNTAEGEKSFAAGTRARANHDGAFVWADNSSETNPPTAFTSTDVDQFLIRAVGGVGIGTNSPTSQLSVNGGADFDSVQIGTISGGIKLDIAGGAWDPNSGEGDVRIGSPTQRLKIGVSTGGGGAGISRLNAVGDVPRIILGVDNDDVVTISPEGVFPTSDDKYSLGTSTRQWTAVYATNTTIQTSDLRLKKDVKAIGYGLKEILALQPASFGWKTGRDRSTHLGLIAQEVELVIPEVVVPPRTAEEHYGMEYAELIPVLIQAIQDQQKIIESQEHRLAALESRSVN